MDKKAAENDDIVIEEEQTEDSGLPAVAREQVKKLKEKIKALEKESKEHLDGWQRERADFVNFKKRIEQEKIETVKFANENLIADLLSVVESFDMAFANKEIWEKVDKNWRVGVEYIHAQFLKILKDNGLAELDPAGEKFDPAKQVAEEIKEVTDENEDGTILAVKKKGFSLNGRILVAPQVVVGELKK
ncbi:MAG: nucleotide exchange factor GrpE [Patescibacteria group bacterium]|nr:nucleotide exchange factor GrpE [Patescibacteria group bacterium]MDE1945915.1 nucleotide exchange factor GrpE [Patescibacteria group bacterium]